MPSAYAEGSDPDGVALTVSLATSPAPQRTRHERVIVFISEGFHLHQYKISVKFLGSVLTLFVEKVNTSIDVLLNPL